MTFGRNIGGGATAQCVAPDHQTPLGTINGVDASLLVPDGASIESDPAPRDGVVMITIPAIVVRVRVDIDALAIVSDFAYIGAYTWPMPITKGERVSLYGDGGSGTATVSMAK